MEPGVEYELSLEQSFFGQPAEYCTMRYRDDFKPSQACRSGAGSLRISGNQVSLELPNAKTSHPAVQFEGVLEHGKGGLDYVLLCDEDGFRLEALAGHVHDVRHIRNSNGPAVNGQTAAVNGKGPAVSHSQAIQQPETEAEMEQIPRAIAAAGDAEPIRCQTSQSAAEQVPDRTPEQNALTPIQLSDSQSACEQRDDIAARQTDSQSDSTCSEEASLDTSPSHPLHGSEAHAATLEQVNSGAAHSSHRSSSGQTAGRQGTDSEHHPSSGGADRSKSSSSSSSCSDSDSEGDDDSCDDQSPATEAQERSNEAAAAVQEVHLSEEERQFLGLSNAPDGQTEYI